MMMCSDHCPEIYFQVSEQVSSPAKEPKSAKEETPAPTSANDADDDDDLDIDAI
jgi:hypothetical protein